MTKYVVISDLHQNSEALDAIIKDIENDINLIEEDVCLINLGDDGPRDEQLDGKALNSIYQKLKTWKSAGGKLKLIHGNHSGVKYIPAELRESFSEDLVGYEYLINDEYNPEANSWADLIDFDEDSNIIAGHNWEHVKKKYGNVINEKNKSDKSKDSNDDDDKPLIIFHGHTHQIDLSVGDFSYDEDNKENMRCLTDETRNILSSKYDIKTTIKNDKYYRMITFSLSGNNSYWINPGCNMKNYLSERGAIANYAIYDSEKKTVSFKTIFEGI